MGSEGKNPWAALVAEDRGRVKETLIRSKSLSLYVGDDSVHPESFPGLPFAVEDLFGFWIRGKENQTAFFKMAQDGIGSKPVIGHEHVSFVKQGSERRFEGLNEDVLLSVAQIREEGQEGSTRMFRFAEGQGICRGAQNFRKLVGGDPPLIRRGLIPWIRVFSGMLGIIFGFFGVVFRGDRSGTIPGWC